MPINIPSDLPAYQTLLDENIFVMPSERAVQQDIRPLRAAIFNLMPKKIETETQLLRLMSNSPLQVDITLLRTETHISRHTAIEYLDRFYKTSYWGRLDLRKGRAHCTVYARDIYYVEASGKSSVVHFAEGEDVFTHMVAELETLLAPSRLFFRVHRSFIVNMMYVSAYDAREITLTNGAKIPLKSKSFAAAYKDFMFRQIG